MGDRIGVFGGTFDPRFSWKILNYGRIMNEIAAQDAIFQQRAIEYQQQILLVPIN